MKKLLLVMAGAAMLAAPALAQTRPLRLFFSNSGLSDAGNTNSAAVSPAQDMGINPKAEHPTPGLTTRLWVWAQILGPGGTAPTTPNNVTFNGVSLRVNASGPGTISGFNFWNYSNGTYGGNAGRWQQHSSSALIPGSSHEFSGAAVTAGAGVNNTAAAATNDTQYIRGAAPRLDVTLLGWVDVTGNAQGTVELRFAVGTLGIAQSGGLPGDRRIYMGWGDEGSSPLNNQVGGTSPVADAMINVAPEPASLSLLALAGLVALRRR